MICNSVTDVTAKVQLYIFGCCSVQKLCRMVCTSVAFLYHKIEKMKHHFYSDPIPVKPWVAKFFAEGHKLKPYLLPAVHALFSKNAGLDKDVCLAEYTHSIKLELPERVFHTKGWMLTRQNTVVFNCLVEGYIKDRFETELEANIRRSHREERKFSFKDMVQDLSAHYGFSEEDLPFQTIKKALQRYCVRENIDLQGIKIYAKNVPHDTPHVAIAPGMVPRADFIRALEISERTYSRMKNVYHTISVQRIGRYDFVNIANSSIANIIKATTN